MKGTISARAYGGGLHRERSHVFDKYCTSAVPHNITLFVASEIIIVPESICGLWFVVWKKNGL